MQTQGDELAAWLRLSLTRGVGNGTARRLLAAFGLPSAVFAQTATALAHIASAAQIKSLHALPEGFAAQLQATLDWLHGGGAGTASGCVRQIVTLGDALYPPALLHTEDPPLMLYLHGNAAVWAGLAGKAVGNDMAIVGSRNPTPQGVQNARSFAKSFAQAGLHVVSGLALGIDGAAHLGALDALDEAQQAGASTSSNAGFSADLTGRTIAVVGTGLDRVYPKAHYELAHRIAQTGVIVSEFPIGTPPLPDNFPRRNRIISALTQGTLVVEAAVKSGSLITARMATEQGKDVFAIPGSIHSAQSKGCHWLIKQGAKLVESADDVLGELSVPLPAALLAKSARSNLSKTIAGKSMDTTANSQFDAPLFAQEPDGAGPDSGHEELHNTSHQAVLDALGFDPVSLDALIARTGIDTAHLQAALMELELSDRVRRLAGGLYARYVDA